MTKPMFSLFTEIRIDIPTALPAAEVLRILQGSFILRVFGEACPRSGMKVWLDGLAATPALPAGVVEASSRCGTSVRLQGWIRTPILLKLFVGFWLGFALLWTMGAFFATVGDSEVAFLPLTGLVMMAAGFGFFRLTNGFGRAAGRQSRTDPA